MDTVGPDLSATASVVSGGPDIDSAEVTRRQLDVTFRRASPMHVAMPFLGGCVVWALWGLLSPAKLWTWYAILCLAGFNSLRMRWAYLRANPKDEQIAQWSADRTAMSVLNGTAVGLAGTLLFVPGSTEVQSFMLLLICGTVAATVMASSGHMGSLMAYLVFTMPPAGIRLIMEGHPPQVAMGGFALAYFVVAGLIGYNNNRLEARAIRLDLQNRRLIQELTEATSLLEKSNEDLNQRVRERTAELRQSHERLEERVVERTAELERLQQELVARNRELEDFAFAVSHDLKNGLVEVQRMLEAAGQDPIRLGEAAPFLLDSTARSMSFVGRILHLARAGRVIARRHPVSLAPMLTTLFERHRHPGDEAGLEISEELPPVLGDAAALEQVFSNLLVNALEHRDPDKPALILVSSHQEQGQVVISVRDNGRGIAAEDLERVFDTSFTSGKEGHFGFGLAIVKKITEAHGGTVRARSAGLGQGAEFLVSLAKA